MTNFLMLYSISRKSVFQSRTQIIFEVISLKIQECIFNNSLGVLLLLLLLEIGEIIYFFRVSFCGIVIGGVKTFVTF